jgi:hypothetical protein
MKNTNQTLAILLLMAVLLAGGLSLVSMQKAMAQGMSDEPDGKTTPDQKDNPDKDQNESREPVTEPKENAPVTTCPSCTM